MGYAFFSAEDLSLGDWLKGAWAIFLLYAFFGLLLALALVAIPVVVVGGLALLEIVSSSVFNLALSVGIVITLAFALLVGLGGVFL